MTQSFLFSQTERLGNFIKQKLAWGFILPLLLPILAVALTFWSPSAGKEIFSPVCHQTPNRSFALAGISLPLCARCLGLYAGIGLTGLLMPIVSRRFSIKLFVLTVAASAGFFFLRYFWPVLDANLIRLLSGLLLGATVALFLKSYLKK